MSKYRSISYEFRAYELDTDELLNISVTAKVYEGTTSNMGDDPTDVEILNCTDQYGKDCWKYLSKRDQEILTERALDTYLDGAS